MATAYTPLARISNRELKATVVYRVKNAAYMKASQIEN